MDEDQLRKQLVAIAFADTVGYSRLMATEAPGTISALDVARLSFRSIVEARQGRVVDTASDSVRAVLETAVGAVGSRCRGGVDGCFATPDRRQFLAGAAHEVTLLSGRRPSNSRHRAFKVRSMSHSRRATARREHRQP